MLHRPMQFFAIALLVCVLPACATVTTGSSSNVSVVTDPVGAACTLLREGSVVGAVNPTPGTVRISKSVKDLRIECSKEGHSSGVATVEAEFQPVVLGNVLVGGVVGIVVDAASGALGSYPESVTIVLPPNSFPTAAERDRYFRAQVQRVRSGYVTRIETARGTCPALSKAQCNKLLGDLVTERRAELARLEGLRQVAQVAQVAH